MEQYALYLSLRYLINSLNANYKTSFNDMDLNKGGVVGVYIRGAEPSDYRDLASGEYYNYSARVQLLFQCENNQDKLLEMLGLISKVRSALVRASNSINPTLPVIRYLEREIIKGQPETQEQEIKVRYNLTRLLGEVEFKGKTGQGLSMYSLNIKIFYNIEGGTSNASD